MYRAMGKEQTFFSPTASGVCAAPGSVSGGGSAAHQCVGGSGCVSASGSLQTAAAGVQPSGSPAAGAPQC